MKAVGWMDGWNACFFWFIFPQGKRTLGIFFQAFCFQSWRWMDGFLDPTKIRTLWEDFGLLHGIFLTYLDPPRGAERMGKGAIQNTTHWRVLVLLFSLIQLFRICVEEISRGFPNFWRRGRSQESFNWQQSFELLTHPSKRNPPQKSCIEDDFVALKDS